PMKGWRSAVRRTDACEAPVGPALSGQARHLARRLASPYGGRPPPGAHTVAILGAGAALPLAGIGAGSVTANSHVRVVVPGGGPLPPAATVPQPPPQDATPRSAFRMPPDDAPSMSKAGNACSIGCKSSSIKKCDLYGNFLCSHLCGHIVSIILAATTASGSRSDSAHSCA